MAWLVYPLPVKGLDLRQCKVPASQVLYSGDPHRPLSPQDTEPKGVGDSSRGDTVQLRNGSWRVLISAALLTHPHKVLGESNNGV